MKLVFVETQEEWELIRGFLSENLQSRSQFEKKLKTELH